MNHDTDSSRFAMPRKPHPVPRQPRVHRSKRVLLAVSVAFSGLTAVTSAVPAHAACPTSGWYVSNQRVATSYESGSFPNGAQLIQFRTGTGWIIYKNLANCTVQRAIMVNANQYRVRNKYPFAWTSWKYFTYGGANACGTHPIAPGRWGCRWADGYWAHW